MDKFARTLVEIDFHVCCNHMILNPIADHDTINALKKQFNNIQSMNVTKPVPTKDHMCIIGTAKIEKSKKAEFEKALKNSKIDPTGVRKIIDVLVWFPVDLNPHKINPQ